MLARLGLSEAPIKKVVEENCIAMMFRASSSTFLTVPVNPVVWKSELLSRQCLLKGRRCVIDGVRLGRRHDKKSHAGENG
jgi:hypothetical protein